MSKHNNRSGQPQVGQSQSSSAAVAEPEQVEQAQPVEQEPQAQTGNRTLVYRRDHPGNRCSYGIAGVPGIVVFDKSLFVDGNAPTSIDLDCDMVLPKADMKAKRAEEAAQRLIERAQKAQARIDEATRKAAEKKALADEALAKAKQRAAEAQALLGKTQQTAQSA